MSEIKVSVIVPIFKVENYLFQCIKSITDQTLYDIEIILVDEGDDDTCYAIMCYFSEIDTRVKIIHKYHGGYGASVNAGINAAQGKYIAIVESDDFIEKTMLEDMYKVAEQHKADFVKTPFYEFYDGEGGNSSYKKDCFRRKQFAHFSAKPFTLSDHPEILCDHAAIWAALYKKDYLIQNNIFFHEAKGAGYVDLNFRLDVYLAAKKIIWLDQPYYNWRITNTESSTQLKNVTHMLTRWNEACLQLTREQTPETLDLIAPALIHELYWTAINWIKQRQAITVEQAQMLENVMAFFTVKHIKQSKFINSRMRKELLQIKEYAEQHKIYDLYSTNPVLTITSSSIFEKITFNIHLSHNRFLIHLFPKMKKNYFSQQLILFNIFSLKVVIGNAN